MHVGHVGRDGRVVIRSDSRHPAGLPAVAARGAAWRCAAAVPPNLLRWRVSRVSRVSPLRDRRQPIALVHANRENQSGVRVLLVAFRRISKQ